MLETVDKLIRTIINVHYGYNLDDIIYSPEDYALRARYEKLEPPNVVIPFVSYYRTVCEPDWERYRKAFVAGRGIVTGFDTGEDKYIFQKVMPINEGYDIVFWVKNGVDINSIIKNHIFKTGRITVVSFSFQSGTVNLDCDISKLDYAIRIPKQEEFLLKGMVYNASFRFNIKSFIVQDPTMLGLITKVFVTVGLSADDPDKNTYELDIAP